MPLRLDVRKKLSSRSDRVKSVDLHPTEDWMLASLYNGNVHVWNYETQQIAKTFEVCDLPVRAVKFVARKHWVLTGSDDMKVRVFNYNTLERVHQFDAHADYIRSLAVHPTNSFVLTSSDDMSIKLWDWDKKWTCTQVFEGHTHYVMQVAFNPKDNNSFASASLDRTIKVWQLGSSSPNFTLEGHEKGVNCVSYYAGGDKPYLISGADDRNVKIWDYQNKACVQTLQGHAHNIAAVAFHPELPIVLSGSEDGTFRIWHANTYRLESTLNYGMERGWALAVQKGSNHVALGYDEGCVLIQLGREEPAMSMDSMGKILWAKHAEIQQANIKSLSSDTEVKDGEPLPLDFKDLGSSDLYPQSVRHNSNGRFVVVCGDGEYVVYTAMALRNKCFGAALEFVWSANDGNEYALRENNSQVRIFKNFKEKTTFKPDFGVEGIYGGHLLGVKSSTGLAFYDWDNAKIVRRIEIGSKNVLWNESGTLVCIVTDENFFILKYDPDAASKGSKIDEDGIEDAFDVVGEVAEVMRTGVWVGDCFIYTNSMNRLNYFVGGEIVTVSHLDKICYILGYLPKENRIFLGDKEMNVISYSLLLSVMEYQTCVMRQDFTAADQILPTIPKEHRSRVAHFLEKQGFKAQALAVTSDPEHQFDLALHLGDLKTAVGVASNPAVSTEQKWKQLAEVATRQCDFKLAQHCLHQAEDFGGLLLMATAAGNANMVETLGSSAAESGKNNIAFLSYFVLGKLEECLEVLIQSNRLAEAAFFARTYLPSQISRVVTLWKESVAKKNAKAASAIADPTDYENLFPGLRQSFQAENYLRTERNSSIPALAYPSLTPNEERDVEAEVAASLADGADLDSVVNPPPVTTADAAPSSAAPIAPWSAAPTTEAVEEPRYPESVTSSEIPTLAAFVVDSPSIVASSSPRPETPPAPLPSAVESPAIDDRPPVSKEELIDVCQTLAAQQLEAEEEDEEEDEEEEEEEEENELVGSSSMETVVKVEVKVVVVDAEEAVRVDQMAEVTKKVEHVTLDSTATEVEDPRRSPSPIKEKTPEAAAAVAPPPSIKAPSPSLLDSFLSSTSAIPTPNSAAFQVSTPAFFQSFVSAPLGDLIGSLSGSSTPPTAAEMEPTPAVVERAPLEAEVAEPASSSFGGAEGEDDGPFADEVVEETVVAAEEENVSKISPTLPVTSTEIDVLFDAAPYSATLLPDLLAPSSGTRAPVSTPDVAAAASSATSSASFFGSISSTPFNDLFNAAIETLKKEPEVKLDLLDPLADDSGKEEEGKTEAEVGRLAKEEEAAAVVTESAEVSAAEVVEAAAAAAAAQPLLAELDSPALTPEPTPDVSSSEPLVDFDSPLIPLASSSSVEVAQSSSAVAEDADPFGAWDESDPVADALEAEKAAAEKSPSPVAGGARKEKSPPVADDADDADDADFEDDWGDDAWGEDFEEEEKEKVESTKATAVVKMRGVDVDAMLDAELDLDLDDINLDNIDTADLNLSDDLLSD